MRREINSEIKEHEKGQKIKKKGGQRQTVQRKVKNEKKKNGKTKQ